ncbi:BON domain-containing protein [Maribacter sp. ACAM166]|uniref:BON domain-containing protein n=1 Tax=Maribacter sp. ACAM166 TaxID=2508996 RepID=UPI0010FE1976|nr:BON domain-containing protein [Maribacter sp. ACAM166]TLP81735.1 BON domain-containing protein [Maribacter sp. ACAM166]
MKSDAQIKQDILDELVFQPNIDETQIGVIVEDGVVTLTGFVDEFPKKVAAEKAAKSVAGVKAVAEDIEVKYGDNYKKTDKEIAKAAVNALEWNASVPKEKVMVKVDNGYIYLTGELPWEYQKNAAKRTIQNLLGVKGVINNIEITPTAKPENIGKEIQKALERSADLEAKGIRVQVDGRTVQLKGRVHSHLEKELAENAAYKAPGVKKVRNDIVVQLYPEFA